MWMTTATPPDSWQPQLLGQGGGAGITNGFYKEHSRNVLGTKSLGDILSERESIAQDMQETLDEATEPWGVKVERVEVKDVRLPQNLQRAMSTEAETVREARAKVSNF